MWISEDLRYGLRALARNRAVAIAAVVSLALGVGANATIFTLLNAILLRPLPIQDPSTLAALCTLDRQDPGYQLASYPNYRDYRDRNTVFSSLLLYSAVTVNLTGRGDPRLLMGQLVSANYFSTLGVNPVVGRAFLPEEDAVPDASPVVVLSNALWTREFAGDPQVTSHSLILNGRSYRIVGVAPPGFGGVNELYAADVWVPFMMYRQLHPAASWVEQRRALLFSVVGRLQPGVSRAAAEASLQILARDLEREYPADNAGRRIRLTSVSEAALAPPTRNLVRNAGLVLMVVSGLVLLVACANVANLLLARATGRGREIAIRLAMGAARWRLIRQLLGESLLLAVPGGAAALLVARWARDLVWSMRPSTFRYAAIDPHIDSRVLAYTFAVALLTALAFGLAPAIRATRADLATDLKDRTGRPAFSTARFRPRSVLVAGQVAFSVVALVGAGLFVRSLQAGANLDLGFDAPHLASVSFNLSGLGYSESRGRQYQKDALAAAASVPGVVSATLSKDVPLNVSAARTVLLDQDGPSGQGRVTLTSVVWPGYFHTVGIPLLRGREFRLEEDATRPRLAILNQAAADAFWPGDNPIGKQLHFFGDSRSAEVVGIARNACYRSIGEDPQPLIYLSLLQYYFPTGALYVRVAGNPESAGAAVRRAVQPLDRNLLLESESLARTLRESLWAQRLCAWLLAAFGVLALLLASVGIYGVISYSVNQRAREIGVRMAMGATMANVRLMILREGFRPVAAGLLLGLAVAWAASRSVAGLLFAAAHDTLIFLLAPSVLVAVAALACWFPARRATRVDPARALREE
jgi:predicted permease